MNLSKYHRRETDFYLVETEIGYFDAITTIDWGVSQDGTETERGRETTIKRPYGGHHIHEQSTYPPRILLLIREDVEKRIAKKGANG